MSCCEILNNFTTVLQVKPFEMFGGETDHSELAHVQKKKVEMLGFFKEMKWHKKSVYAWQSAMETDLL